ncbi:MAG: tetratricopeptide repeat protein, partial [Fidelibacterota bacterium]
RVVKEREKIGIGPIYPGIISAFSAVLMINLFEPAWRILPVSALSWFILGLGSYKIFGSSYLKLRINKSSIILIIFTSVFTLVFFLSLNFQINALRSDRYFIRALGDIVKKKHRPAVQMFNRSLKASPYNDLALFYMARNYLSLTRYDDALRTLNRLNSFFPAFPKSHFYKAQSYRVKGDVDNSLRELKREFRLKSDLANRFTLAQLFLEKGMPDSAKYLMESEVKRGIKTGNYAYIDPVLPFVIDLYMDYGGWEKNIPLFEEAVAVFPGEVDLLQILAAGYVKKGDERRARELYGKIKKLERIGPVKRKR